MQYTEGDITIIKDSMQTKKATIAIKVLVFSKARQIAETKWLMIISGEPNEEQLPVIYHDISIDLDTKIQEEHIASIVGEAFHNYLCPDKDSYEDITIFKLMKSEAIRKILQMI